MPQNILHRFETEEFWEVLHMKLPCDYAILRFLPYPETVSAEAHAAPKGAQWAKGFDRAEAEDQT
jgi:hypothetical protein